MAGEVVLALAVIVVVFASVLCILRERGLLVQLTACSFITSLVVTQLTMKELSSAPFNFKFPAFVSTLHFCSVWFCCLVYWSVRQEWAKCHWSSIGTFRQYLATVLPIALSLPLSVILSNRAMIYVGAAVTAAIGTLAPISTAVLSHLFGRRLTAMSWSGVGVAFVGACFITWAETTAAFDGTLTGPNGSMPFGIALALGAVLSRSVKVVLQDALLKPQNTSTKCHAAQPLQPLHLWVLQGPACAFVSGCIVVCTEDVPSALEKINPEVSAVILCTCCFATVLNLTGMVTIRDLGASSMQIVGKLNTLVTMALSVVLFGETLPLEAVIGTALILLGVAIFEWGEHKQPEPAETHVKSLV